MHDREEPAPRSAGAGSLPNVAAHTWAETAFTYRAVTVAFTAWMVFWVPTILWSYGPQNFLWLCNISQFVYLYALWRRHALLASSQAGLLLIVGGVWTADFLGGVATGGQSAVMTHYMWLDEIPLIARLSSLYHIFLPVLAVFLVATLGYDRRAPWLQTGIGTVALAFTALFTEPYRNVNWLYAPFNIEQVWMPHGVYVLLVALAYPVLLFWPGHFLMLGLLRVLRPVRARSAAQ